MEAEKQRMYLCIDGKSFYASVECAERGLNPFETNLVVADPSRGKNALCLAITPKMKALGVHNRCRLSDIPANIKYEIAAPRMSLYVDYCADIYALYLNYFAAEDIHVYSIDEAFIDVTNYLHTYGMDAKQLAKKLMNEIADKLHVPTTAGIGTNLYLAKIALDISAKKTKDHMGYLDEETFRKTLWNHTPLTDFWGIAHGTANRLSRYGIFTMCDIANAPQDLLYKVFGINEEFKAVHTRCAVPMWKEFRSRAVLPDDLIPVISKKDMDAIAFRMSNALNPRVSTCGALLRPCQAVKGLGLTVEDVHFDSDGEILAKIFFEDARTMVIDPQTGIRHIISVSAGTILVNVPVGKVLDERVRNNTIMHECIHWMLHRPAFLLAKLWNHEYSAIACRRASSNSQPRQWTAIDRMEWQANALAPRILMPNWATQLFASGWLRRYSWLSPILRMEKTIDQLSRQFNVSRQLAKIRMEELGYEDAKAAFSYYDKRKHTISFENAARELARNKAFRDALETGIYAYVDNYFVIRDSRYIYRDETGKLHLTSFAKAHLDECCLAFVSRRINRGMQYGMLRYNVEDETFITGSETTPADLAKKTNSIMGVLQNLPSSFSETLVAHMKRKGVTIEQLAESTLMSNRQIYRFRSALYPNITLPQVVGLCIGLKLHPIFSRDLIEKAGFTFNMSPQNRAYHMLILTMSNNSIYECNEYLAEVGLAPIGKEE